MSTNLKGHSSLWIMRVAHPNQADSLQGVNVSHFCHHTHAVAAGTPRISRCRQVRCAAQCSRPRARLVEGGVPGLHCGGFGRPDSVADISVAQRQSALRQAVVGAQTVACSHSGKRSDARSSAREVPRTTAAQCGSRTPLPTGTRQRSANQQTSAKKRPGRLAAQFGSEAGDRNIRNAVRATETSAMQSGYLPFFLNGLCQNDRIPSRLPSTTAWHNGGLRGGQSWSVIRMQRPGATARTERDSRPASTSWRPD